MRILFLAHRLPYPPNKGDKIRSFWELKTLSAQHEVDLFCFYDDPADEEHVSTVSRYCRTCYAEKLSVMGSRLRALGSAAVGKPFSLGFFHSPQMAGRIREAVSNREYDLVFVYSSPMAQYLTGISAVPRILDMVDVDSLKWEQYAERAAPPYSWLWRREARNLAEFEKQVVQEFSLTLVCTEAEAESLRRMKTAGEVASLSHPLDLDYFDPEQTPLPAEIAALRPYLVFTGSMDYYPNVDGVLHFYRQVFPWLRAQIPSLRFVIVGRNPAQPIRRLAVDAAVHVTGSVPDVRPYLRGAAAAVVPLRIARGLQNKIIEAMAMGLPVATSRLTALALPPDLASFLIVEDDPLRLSERLAHVISAGSGIPPETIRRAIAERFDGARLAQEFAQLLARAQRLDAENRRSREGHEFSRMRPSRSSGSSRDALDAVRTGK